MNAETLTSYLRRLTDRNLLRPRWLSAMSRQPHFLAKLADLTGLSVRHLVSALHPTMWRRFAGFQARGVIGYADKRGLPSRVRKSTTDPRVYAAINAIRLQHTEKSTPTKKQVIELATAALADQNVSVPPRSTMYTILDDCDRGMHTFGTATARRSQATSPDRAYGTVTALYPGQEVQLDATPIGAMALLNDLIADAATDAIDTGQEAITLELLDTIAVDDEERSFDDRQDTLTRPRSNAEKASGTDTGQPR